jgi:hypothetical protein
VIGWTDPEGARPRLGALLLAYYDPHGRLTYAGRVGTETARKGRFCLQCLCREKCKRLVSVRKHVLGYGSGRRRCSQAQPVEYRVLWTKIFGDRAIGDRKWDLKSAVKPFRIRKRGRRRGHTLPEGRRTYASRGPAICRWSCGERRRAPARGFRRSRCRT